MKRILVLVPLLVLLTGCAQHRADHQSSATTASDVPRVSRVWRGRVSSTRADEYDAYIREAGLSKLRQIPRNRGVQLFRRALDDGTTEFVVISYWDSRDDIRAYAGSDIEKVRDMPRDHEFLIDREPIVRHYDIREQVWQQSGQ
jgi:heme-degrading monooxygenase HmoA